MSMKNKGALMYGAKSQEPNMPKTALSDAIEASFDYDTFIREWVAFRKRHQRNSHISQTSKTIET